MIGALLTSLAVLLPAQPEPAGHAVHVIPVATEPTVTEPTVTEPTVTAPDTSGQAPARLTVGAFYYPWYGAGRRRDAERSPAADLGWMAKTLRGHLQPRQFPRLGVYDSRNEAVIADHIAQSVRANIAFWAVSWWGPNRRDDQTFREHILNHPDAGRLKYAVLYESTGRLGSFQQPDYQHLVSDFDYLATHFFNHPNYLHINGKPVVFLYLTRVYFRNRGQEPLSALRAKHPGLYLIGDEVFGPNYRQQDAQPWDAVTAYDVYGQSLGIDGAHRTALERLSRNYAHAKEMANRVDRAFVPTVSPGYNDRAVRAGHAGRGRYFEDVADSQEGDIFRAMLRDCAIPLTDPRANHMIMITSFNEWYEDTQIEATTGSANSTEVDDSASHHDFADGHRYHDYGNLYLDILRQATTSDPPPDEQVGR